MFRLPLRNNKKILGPLFYGVSGKVHEQGLQVVLAKKNYYKWVKYWNHTGLGVTQDKKKFMLLPSVPEENSNGYRTNTITRHN